MSFIYVNREMSWLKFNAYVLEQAASKEVPSIERLRFLGIYSNNLDEFYKVRYAHIFKASLLKNKAYDNIIEKQNAKELLGQINKEVYKQILNAEKLYDSILRELEEENIFILNEKNLSENQKEFISDFFEEKISPILGVYILQDLTRFELKDGAFYLFINLARQDKKNKYALIEVPTDVFSRFVVFPKIGKSNYLIFLEDVLRYHLPQIFSIFNFDKIKAYSIKITRDAEISFDSDLSKTFIEKITRSVEKRKKGLPVRMVYDKEISHEALVYLKSKMGLDQYDSISPGGKYHNRKDLMNFPSLGNSNLTYKKLVSFYPKFFEEKNHFFKKIDLKDQLLCMPYHDFLLFVKFLREAAIDPCVKTIKITIYRVADTSQVMQALIVAARNGKKVTVVLELRARFDEAHNVYWAKKLQAQGIKIISGVVGLKVHAKLLCIERVSKNKIKTYAALSTGNFNEQTARIYSDFILLTSEDKITSEVKEVFDFFETNYKVFDYKHLLVSPNQMRGRIENLIENEIKNASLGLPAYIYLKLNSISDKGLIDKLYLASQAGVKIHIQARSICSLVPKVPNLSENIEAISLVDRFLEHSRVYWFANGSKDLVYISSSDWMTRNLDFRLEVACPIYDEDLKKTIMNILKLYYKDNLKIRHWPDLEKENPKGEFLFRAQNEIYNFLKNKS